MSPLCESWIFLEHDFSFYVNGRRTSSFQPRRTLLHSKAIQTALHYNLHTNMAPAPPTLSTHQLPCDPDGVCMRCKNHPPDEHVLICDGCTSEWHMHCMIPPLTAVPAGRWQCPDCEEIAQAMAAPSADTEKAGNISTVSAAASVPTCAVPAGSALGEASDLVAQIQAIQNDPTLSEKERATRRQELLSGSHKAGKRPKPDAEPNGASDSPNKRAKGEEKEQQGGRRGEGRAVGAVGGRRGEDDPSYISEKLKCPMCISVLDRPVSVRSTKKTAL